MLWRIAKRSLHSTRIIKDMRPQIKQMFTDHQTNKKPIDVGTALILGAPAVGCFGLYIWKQDTEILQPLRDAKELKDSAKQ